MMTFDYNRLLDLRELAAKKSLFLFGPRQTGKSTLLQKQFPEATTYNLLLAQDFFPLSQRPSLLREEVLANHSHSSKLFIIDEIQKLPQLLDEVHALIESHRIKFILTGSSARKLKRSGGNLLAGRAWIRNLYPLVTEEIPHYDFLRLLNFGALPFVYNSSLPNEELQSYVWMYLREEIAAEGIVRKIDNFSNFLQQAALHNSELLNFSNVASDAGVPQRTVIEYYQILEDTLLGHLLKAFRKTKKRKAISTGKFYFFDVGVSNFLAGRTSINPKTELFGKVFEHFLFTELRAWNDYQRVSSELSFWRSTSGFEVDFLIGDHTAIEVKGTSMVHAKHLKGLGALAEEIKLKRQIVVSLDKRPRKIGKIEILPYSIFLKNLWSGEYNS